MGSGVHGADAVEGGHNAPGNVGFQSALETAQFDLTDGLLGVEGTDTGPVGLLVVGCKVLGLHHHAFMAAADADCKAHDIGEHGVFGIVFVVSGAVDRAVIIKSGAHDGYDVGPQAVLAEQLAFTLHKFLIESGCHHGFGGHNCHEVLGIFIVRSHVGRFIGLGVGPVGGISGHLIVHEADGAVLDCHIGTDSTELELHIGALFNVGKGLVESHFVNQLVPDGIAYIYDALDPALIVHVEDAGKIQPVLCAPCLSGPILGELIVPVLQTGHHGIVCSQISDGLPAFGPVASGGILGGIGNELIDVGPCKGILDILRISLHIAAVQCDLDGSLRINDLILAGLYEILVAAQLIGKNIVERFMGTVADGEIVIARIQHPGACGACCLHSGIVIACHILCIKVDRDLLGFARLEDSGL